MRENTSYDISHEIRDLSEEISQKISLRRYLSWNISHEISLMKYLS